jgi:ribosomal protein L40E
MCASFFTFIAGITLLITVVALHNWRRRRFQRYADRIEGIMYGQSNRRLASGLCHRCGASLPPTAAFCPQCGLDLRDLATSLRPQNRPLRVFFIILLLGILALAILMYFAGFVEG